MLIDSKFFGAESILLAFNLDSKDNFEFDKYVNELREFGDIIKLENDGLTALDNGWVLLK